MIGRYLDALTDEYRDRAISAVNWRTGKAWPDVNGARCLIGHVEDWHNDYNFDSVASRMRRDFAASLATRPRRTVALTFDRLVARFGLERTVRAIKQRAAKHNRVALPDSAVPLHAGAAQT